MTLIFATDLHHLVIAALNDSYTLFQPGDVPLLGDIAALTTRTVASAFRIGIQLSAPFLVFGLLFNLGLGVLSRLMPQMQVFFVGMPLSILVGFLILLLVVGAMMATFLGSVESVLRYARSERLSHALWPTNATIPNARKTPPRSASTRRSNAATWSRARRSIPGSSSRAGTLVLLAFSGSMGGGIATSLRGLIANSYAIRVDGRGLIDLMNRLGLELLSAVAIPFLLLVLAAIGGNLIQHRLVWSAEALKPKLSKISPAAGLKRLFSKQALANFIKGLLKLALLGGDHGGAACGPRATSWRPWWRSIRPPCCRWRNRCRSTCSASSSPCSHSSLRPTICSSIANGSSARRCRCAS